MLAARHALPERLRRMPWGLLVVEFLAIFLSVLLATAVNDWDAERRAARLRRTALEQFLVELRANRDRVAERLPYHRDVMEGFSGVMERPPASLDAAMEQAGFQGPRWVSFSQAAWRTADAAGALPLLDFRVAGVLSGTYGVQEELAGFQRAFTNMAFDPSSFAEANVRGGTRAALTYFAVVVELENALLQYQYPAAIRAVESALGLPTDTTEADVPEVDTTAGPR